MNYLNRQREQRLSAASAKQMPPPRYLSRTAGQIELFETRMAEDYPA
jgi:hypothetical protein